MAAYRQALLERFDNSRIRHTLAQIAADGSAKLPVRILPVLRLRRAEGVLPEAAVTVLAAWVLHLRGAGAPVTDVNAVTLRSLVAGPLADAVPRALAALDPAAAEDVALVSAVRCRTDELA